MQNREQPQLSPFSLNRIDNIFLFNGITALLGWNAALGSFDYFQYIYKDYNVYLYFPIPVFISYGITGVLFYYIARAISYRKLVISGIIGVNIALALLLILTLIFKDNNVSTGYWISLFVLCMLGFSANMTQLSFFAMINYFGKEAVSKFVIGTAASGLLIMLVRAAVTGIFGADEPGNIAPIAIYIGITIAFNIFDMYLNFKLFKTSQYQQKIENKSTQTQKQVQYEKSLVSSKQGQQNMEVVKELSYGQIMWQSLKVTNPFSILIFFNYVLTFMLFPDLTLLTKTSFGGVWSAIIMLISYNIGDFVGKIVGDFRGVFNATSIIYLFFARFYFFYTITLMDKQFTQEDRLLNNDFFPFFNQFLFSFTNGLVTNGCFILSYEKAPNQFKNFAGVLCGILLQIGIMAGTFLAIPLQKSIHPDVAL